MLSPSQEVFLALVRAGLWEKEVQLSLFENIDWLRIYQQAQEQALNGLVLAGIDQSDVKPPKELLLQWIGEVQQIEHRNVAMNHFIGEYAEKMTRVGINTLLVKGQGIAQSYERPLWRSSGDIDFLLTADNYEKAYGLFSDKWKEVDYEKSYKKHSEFIVGSWDVELHGTMKGEVSAKIDKVIEDVQNETFQTGNVRKWHNGETDIFIPAPDNDVIFIFTHILQHFFRGGIGLRQICDWSRLLWTYKDSLNHELLESRIRKMDVMTEWRTFAALAVNTLGMSVEAMPLYSSEKKYIQKSQMVLDIIFEIGNFGHNRDESYKNKVSFWKRMTISLTNRTVDFFKQARIFPSNACRAYLGIWKTGIEVVKRHH